MRRLNLRYLDIRFRIRVTKFKGINLIALRCFGNTSTMGWKIVWFDSSICDMDRKTLIEDPEEIERLKIEYPMIEIVDTETQLIWKVSFNGKEIEVPIDKDKIIINNDGSVANMESISPLLVKAWQDINK
jgi:hypothetical protein